MVSKKRRKRIARESALVFGAVIGSQVVGGLPSSQTQQQGQEFFTKFSGGFGTLGTIESASLVLGGVEQLDKATSKRRKKK